MVEIVKAAKEILFREGEAADAAFIIKKGAVEILKHAEHGEVQLAVLEAGDVFGEMALMEPRNTRSATARTLTEATLDRIEEADFSALIGQCPEEIRRVMASIILRLRDTNRRLADKERATVVLDNAIQTLTITAASEAVAIAPITLPAAQLHFSIGGYPKKEEAPHRNDLDLPSEGPPLMISQRHCTLQNVQGEIFIVDEGSRFCTIVNGKVIGRAKASERAPLHMGENKVTLGDHTSPYKIIITCE